MGGRDASKLVKYFSISNLEGIWRLSEPVLKYAFEVLAGWAVVGYIRNPECCTWAVD